MNINIPKNIEELIEQRLCEFASFSKKSNEEWFSELCFCILTANSKALNAIKIQQYVTPFGFLNYSQELLASIIKSHGHRFHNNKSKYIVEARKFSNIKDLIFNLDGFQAREFIVKNIKGLGYKEASHFLRNVGFSDVAIVDRHILRFLLQENFLPAIPATVGKKDYLKCEEILRSLSVNLDKLDLEIWYKMTNTVLK